jgi:putative addiction module component (TIGR02574 family)
MSRNLADLTHEVLDLDDQEREHLVEVLLTSLDRADEIDRAWMEEARRRYEAIRSGRARTLSHDEVVARLEARFG